MTPLIFALFLISTVFGFNTLTRFGRKSSTTSLMMGKYLGSNPVFIAGGSSGIGLEVVKKLSAMGTPCRVLVRRADAKEELDAMPGVEAFLGDAADEDAVQSTMNGCVAAVTTLGGKLDDGRLIDYVGNSCVVEQAGILGCERIILVTSIGCGETKKALSDATYKVLEEYLNEKNKAERDLRMYTNLDWTILRPGGLKDGKATGEAIVTEDVTASGSVYREDVASLVIKALDSDSKATRKELSCIDPSLVGANDEQPAAYVPYEL